MTPLPGAGLVAVETVGADVLRALAPWVLSRLFGATGPLEKWYQLQDWERGSFWMQSLQMGHLLAPTSHRQLAYVLGPSATFCREVGGHGVGSWCWLELDECHYPTGEKTQEGVPRDPREPGALAAGMAMQWECAFLPAWGYSEQALSSLYVSA